MAIRKPTWWQELTPDQKREYQHAISEIRHMIVHGHSKRHEKALNKHLVNLGFTPEEVESDDGVLWFY